MKGKRLSPEIIAQAKELKQQGLTYRQIANQLGISKTAVEEHTKDIPLVNKTPKEVLANRFISRPRLILAPGQKFRGSPIQYAPIRNEIKRDEEDEWEKWERRLKEWERHDELMAKLEARKLKAQQELEKARKELEEAERRAEKSH
jgi:predicted transcriptional regulator